MSRAIYIDAVTSVYVRETHHGADSHSSAEEYEGLRGVTREVWDALSVEAQHDIYRVVVDRVIVHPFGTEPRIEIHWRL